MTKKNRPRCFFDVTIDGAPIGRVVFELFADFCPITCENFRALCTGEKGKGQMTGKPLHYKGCAFHRIVKNFMIQAGDFTAGNGTGGESIYGGTFADENFEMKHDESFLLSMANRGKDTNGSQFFITTRPTPHLDGVHVVFGRLVSGQNVITEVEAQKVDSKSSRPITDIVISHCGELVLKHKKKKKKHKRSVSSEKSERSRSGSPAKEKEKEASDNEDNQEGDGEAPEAKEDEEEQSKENGQISSVTAEEVPEVPGNKFLMRRSQTPPERKREERTHRRRSSPSRNASSNDRRQNHYDRRARNERDYGSRNQSNRDRRGPDRIGNSRRTSYSKSGHKIRGRGICRYRTPSPGSDGRSGSETPPHWRREQAKLRGLNDIKKAAEASLQPSKWEEEDDEEEERGDRLRSEVSRKESTRSPEGGSGRRGEKKRERKFQEEPAEKKRKFREEKSEEAEGEAPATPPALESQSPIQHHEEDTLDLEAPASGLDIVD